VTAGKQNQVIAVFRAPLQPDFPYDFFLICTTFF